MPETYFILLNTRSMLFWSSTGPAGSATKARRFGSRDYAAETVSNMTAPKDWVMLEFQP